MRWIFPAKVNSSIVPRARARPAPSSWAAYDDDEPELSGRGRACGAADRSEYIVCLGRIALGRGDPAVGFREVAPNADVRDLHRAGLHDFLVALRVRLRHR